jgi:cytochrome c nitrite reductase small subunit
MVNTHAAPARAPSNKRGIVIFLVCAMAGILLGVGAYTFYFAKGWSYLSDDPLACVNCHIMRNEYESWSHSSHKAIATCNSCHTPHDLVGKYATKAENGFSHSRAFTFQDFPEPIEMRQVSKNIVLNNCLECHKTLVSTISAPHAGEKDTVDCIMCHRSVGHAGK